MSETKRCRKASMSFLLKNENEVLQSFQTFCIIWGSEGSGRLYLDTKDGEVTLKLEQKLGPLYGLRPCPTGRQDPVSTETTRNPPKKKKSKSQIRRHELRQKASEERCKTKSIIEPPHRSQ